MVCAMRSRSWFLLLLTSCLAAPGCGARDEPRAAPVHVLREGDAPTPFTAEEIRRGCPDGRVLTLRITQGGRQGFLQVIRFQDPDEEGVDVVLGMTALDGSPISTPRTEHDTWKELQARYSFPAKDTTITDDEVVLEAGSFDAWRYDVQVTKSGMPPGTNKFWFAKDFPGPPIKIQKEVAGTISLVSEMVSNEVAGNAGGGK